MKLYISTFLLITFLSTKGQSLPDFSFTDIDGQEHNLFESLINGKTVVLDFFYADCEPCLYYTASLNTLYAEWGSGSADVEFWAFSDIDDNTDLSGFISDNEIAYTVCGLDGGSADVIALFSSLYVMDGYPTYSVICPNQLMSWNIWPVSDELSELNEKISDCGATGIAMFAGGPDQEIITGFTSPNPAHDYVQFISAKSSDIQTIFLSSITGEKFTISYQLNSEGFSFDISTLPQGLYLINILSKNGKMDVQKFLKV